MTKGQDSKAKDQQFEKCRHMKQVASKDGSAYNKEANLDWESDSL